MATETESKKGAQPIIPTDILDAPTQRLYVVAAVVALNAWKLYDFLKLIRDDEESVWLFLKWTAIDGVAVFNIPTLRVPWLQWTFTLSMTLFLLCSIFNGLLMFRVSIPLETIFIGLSKILFDKEMAISERSVRASQVLHNSSLILGKKIIHILPEGAAALNPDRKPLCLGYDKTSIELPIWINQTKPIQLDLLRIDPETHANETIVVGAKELRKLRNKAAKAAPKQDGSEPLTLLLPVKKPGLYRLRKVIDETDLEVRRRALDTYVTTCPTAQFKPTAIDKCFGELSDLKIEVQGVPPLKIKYSRVLNGRYHGYSLQSIHPDSQISLDFLVDNQETIGSVIARSQNLAQVQSIVVPVNETLNSHGNWLYKVDEVHDSQGNVANYSLAEDEQNPNKFKGLDLEKRLAVHERPVVSLSKLDLQTPLKLPFGRGSQVPLNFAQEEGVVDTSDSYNLSILFTPTQSLQKNGEHGDNPEPKNYVLKSANGLIDLPIVREPGLYSLDSIASPFCPGKIIEPSTFMLINPPKPGLSLDSQNIYDNCAGNSIGLIANLELIGTPPFVVHYEVSHSERRNVEKRQTRADLLKHQLELRPRDAGRYTYTFKSVDDAIYKRRTLDGPQYILEQDVKPLASAQSLDLNKWKPTCIGQPYSFVMLFQGEAPWTLEYELVHNGKRKKFNTGPINDRTHAISTEPLNTGGEYVLSLASVEDRSGCKVLLQDEATIKVRQQHPRATFGDIDGAFAISTTKLDKKKVQLPLKLTGEAPWTVWYRIANQTPQAPLQNSEVCDENGFLEVDKDGTYELVEVHDRYCPGIVDGVKNFEVSWISRPQIGFHESTSIKQSGKTYEKNDVCVGDEDSIELAITGTPPYSIKYRQKLAPLKGSKSTSNKALTAGLGKASVRMDTSKAGRYEYEFYELADYLYNHDSRTHKPLLLEQRVNSNPTARFSKPGKTYKYCKEEVSGDEIIPIALEGKSPFHLELAVKHHASSQPEIIKIPNIEGKKYDFRIPDRLLALGNLVVSLRKVRDNNGCQQKIDSNAAKIQVTVSDVPTIEPVDSKLDYCVGDRLAFSLSGSPPFTVFYQFNGKDRRASSTSTVFKRFAESPGNLTINAVSDSASECKANTAITKLVHPLPSVKVSQGMISTVDIPEGAETDILFEFGGTPPFEFTYIRSTNAHRGVKPKVLETKREISQDYSMSVKASLEGTYEVISIRDRYCGFSTNRVEGKKSKGLLGY